MTRVLLFFALLAVLLFLATQRDARGAESLYVPDEVLVKFKAGTTDASIASIQSAHSLETVRFFRRLRFYHMRVRSGLTVDEILARLRQDPDVEYAEPNYYRYSNLVPNDPGYSQMWGLDNTGQTGGTPGADIDAPEAWEITTGSPGLVVAVLDSGMDLGHVDLVSNLWVNPGEIPGNGIDDDGNGFVDDVNGWDFFENDNDPTDNSPNCSGHGTHTAGTVGAAGNNGIGVVGVNWQVKIMPLRFLGGFLCSGSTSSAIAGIEYYTDLGVRVSNNSWGGGPFSQALMDAIRESQSLFVAAAGNAGSDNDAVPSYPASYELDNIISVAATDDDDVKASFSNFGMTSVDLAAPGVGILSTLPGDSYGNLSGTSMATPHVTGVAALLLAQDSSLTNNEAKFRILKGADPIGLPVLTGGRLNARNALNFGLLPPGAEIHVTPVGPTNVSPGDTISYMVEIHNHGSTPATVTAKIYMRRFDGFKGDLDGPVTGSLPAGGSVSVTISKTLPLGISSGTYTLFGQVQTSNSFDEDPVVYTVGP